MRRITKRQARKRFAAGEVIILCPNKMRPEGPFSMASIILPKEWLEAAERYDGHPTLWKGTVPKTAWDMMYKQWAYYNANNECGYYPHYYEDSE